MQRGVLIDALYAELVPKEIQHLTPNYEELSNNHEVLNFACSTRSPSGNQVDGLAAGCNHLDAAQYLSHGFSWTRDEFPIKETDHISLHTQRESKRTHQSKVTKEKLTKCYT